MLDIKVEESVRALLPKAMSKEDFLDTYFTDWYYLESIEVGVAEFLHIKEFLNEKGYYRKSKIKMINKYVYMQTMFTLWK